MKVQIIYVADHKGSEQQATQAFQSFQRHNWNAEMSSGITPDTINENEFTDKIIHSGRLADFKKENYRKYLVKKSCLFNNLKFCKRVIEADEPMVFAEHDAVCVRDYIDFDFDDFCFLALEYAFQPPTTLAKPPLNKWHIPTVHGVNEFPKNYPLTYYRKNHYYGHSMTPGTAAYALAPAGAKKILHAVENHGLDQSDFVINSYNVRMQYLYPSPVRYNNINLNLSHRL
jgi:GR25 family glycosyltransferase involved in LPS biosynthesis